MVFPANVAPPTFLGKRWLSFLFVPVICSPLSKGITSNNVQSAAQSTATYEVATIKLSNPDMLGSGFRVRGLRLESINTSLNDLVLFAYELQGSQLINSPDWGSTAKFDATMLFNGEGIPNDAQCKGMIRQLLENRFGLRFHREEKELPIFALVLSQGGPKLKRSEGLPDGLPTLRFSSQGHFQATNARISDLAQELQRNILSRPVLDQTGLSGRWGFTLAWAPDNAQGGNHRESQPTASNDPDLFTAIQEQLGLKLQAVKAPAGTLVIDSVSRPSEN